MSNEAKLGWSIGVSLVKPTEIATLLGVSVKSVYHWVARHQIPFLKVGKHLRFDPAKVLDHFEQQTREGVLPRVSQNGARLAARGTASKLSHYA